MSKKFKWVVEFTVDETWVADGFEITKERAKGMIEYALPCAYGFETSVKIIEKPTRKELNKAWSS